VTQQKLLLYSQTCVQRPTLGPDKSGRLKEGPDKSKFRLIIDESNWLFLKSGRCSEVVVKAGLTVC
jgi:hypothetical protein